MLDFVYFTSIPSTQIWLSEQIREEKVKVPICVLSEMQSAGIGSRNNHWKNVANALTFSFAFEQSRLPVDLSLQSLSIYIGYLLKEWMRAEGFDVWLKWPNDLYLGDQKVGGVMTQCIKNAIICGIGVNLEDSTMPCIGVAWGKEEKKKRVFSFLEFLFKFPNWFEIFQNYRLEFHKNFDFIFHFKNYKISFRDVRLCEDGAVLWREEKIYSLR